MGGLYKLAVSIELVN